MELGYNFQNSGIYLCAYKKIDMHFQLNIYGFCLYLLKKFTENVKLGVQT